MENTIVLYQSKYGATKKYAKWLSETLNCNALETKSANIKDVVKYDVIILGGGIYASGIAGISFLKKNYSMLKEKKIIVFAVGASPYDEKSFTEIKEHNLKEDLKDIPCFYCRGSWIESAMTMRDKALCKILKSVVSKKDPKDYEPWEAALADAMGSDADWTNEENLIPIIDYIKKDNIS